MCIYRCDCRLHLPPKRISSKQGGWDRSGAKPPGPKLKNGLQFWPQISKKQIVGKSPQAQTKKTRRSECKNGPKIKKSVGARRNCVPSRHYSFLNFGFRHVFYVCLQGVAMPPFNRCCLSVVPYANSRLRDLGRSFPLGPKLENFNWIRQIACGAR